MPNSDLLPSLLSKINENQLALEAAIMELTNWVEQQGGTEVADNVRGALDTIDRNEEFGIGVPPWSEQRSSWVAWWWIVFGRQDANGGANQFPNKEDRPRSTRPPEGVFCVGFGSKYLYRSQPAYVSRSDCKSAYAGSIPTSASTLESPVD